MEVPMATRDPDRSWREHVLSTLPTMEATSMPDPAATSLTPAPTTAVTAPAPFSADYFAAPSLDLLALLPDAAADKLRLLRQRSSDAHALIPTFEMVREANAAKQDAEHQLQRLLAPAGESGFNLGLNDRRTIEAQKTLDKATADARRLTELQEVRSQAWREASGALAAVESWLRDGGRPGNTTLEAVEVEPPKLAKGEDILSALEKVRRRGRELKADIHHVRSACYTKDEAMALVSATVENWGSNGIDTSATIEHLSQPTIPTKTVQAMVHNVPGAPAAVVFVEVPDVVGIFSTVLKDQFIAWLAADVDRNADPKGALSHEARQQQEAELMGDLLDIERQEAALTWQAQAQGLPCEFRHDYTNPLVILQLRLITSPRATNGPAASSPEREGWRR
jgi:hypothetical protein